MVESVKASLPRCPRCRGKMFSNKSDGDSVCFSCGNVVYATPPLAAEEIKERGRRPAHAGKSLS